MAALNRDIYVEQVCITACHKMTNMVCRGLYCQTSVKLPQSIQTSTLLTEMFMESVYKKRRVQHLDFVDHSVLFICAVNTKMPQVLQHKSHTVSLNIVVVSVAAPKLRGDLLVLSYSLYK